jgi:ubiquinone biosynthesis protein COQ9
MEIYCTQLGMLTGFTYCISMNEGLPCRNVIGCWEGRMDIIQFLKERFDKEVLMKVFSGLPKSKLERIVDLITKNQ